MKRKNSLLWEISGDNSEVRAYLFGSIHIKSPVLLDLCKLPLQLLSKVDTLCLETNPEHFNTSKMENFIKLVGTSKLSDYFNPIKYQRIRKSLLRFSGLDIELYSHYKPFFLINFLIENMYEEVSGPPLDMIFLNKAIAENKNITGLLTPETEFENLKKLDNEHQFSELYSFSRNYFSEKRRFSRLLDLYMIQDIHNIYKISKKQIGPLRKSLIYERNFSMFDTIEVLLKKNDKLMIVAGAAHLSGQFGLLRLMKKAGFKLRPVKLS